MVKPRLKRGPGHNTIVCHNRDEEVSRGLQKFQVSQISPNAQTEAGVPLLPPKPRRACVSLPPRLLEQLDMEAARLRVARSVLVQCAVESLLDNMARISARLEKRQGGLTG